MFQHPNIFAYSMWENDFEKILATMPTDTIEQQEAILRMTGLQRYLQQSTDHKHIEIKKLHTYLDEIDRRRRTNWRELFGYLVV
jgi:DNA topoisomerase IB